MALEESILTSTKKMLGVAEEYTQFDLDIITHINSSFSVLYQIINLETVFEIADAEQKWSDIDLPTNQLSLVRTYIYLKTRMLFDPPTTGFLLDALTKVIDEHENRLKLSGELVNLN